MAAAREHQAALRDLPEEPSHYPLAYYLAGLAVECLFRAYTELVGGEHDALLADVGDVWTRWLNNHRYRSLSSLKNFLNANELYRLEGSRSIKGDSDRVVRYNWDVLLEASLRLLNAGINRWQLSKTKWNR